MTQQTLDWVELATQSHAENSASLSALDRRMTTYVSALTDSIVSAPKADDQPTFSMSDETKAGCTIHAKHGETTVFIECEVIMSKDECHIRFNSDADLLGEMTDFNTDDDVTPALQATAKYVGLALATGKPQKQKLQ
ncbi:hypothetical protein [Phaeobacter inhibens]|uniref:hypothetical protein n=1 Tax=Phaeobacter inhibens TaxID=221822 RepID=UPI000CA22CD7|nr:hypothetical protein [Phaeobacter inhibens]AUR22543.1 hypothetical protein PhaeoP80_04520 [Phaeobacter inhibens]